MNDWKEAGELIKQIKERADVSIAHADAIDTALKALDIMGKVEAENNWDLIAEDLVGMLDVNIHGHINHPNKSKRKPVVSRVGKECALTMAKGVVAYLKAVIGPLLAQKEKRIYELYHHEVEELKKELTKLKERQR